MLGRIKNLVAEKRFGFIEADGERNEYFFHRDDLVGHWDDLVADYTMNRNIRVEFEVGHSNKGPRAANVKRLDHPNQAV